MDGDWCDDLDPDIFLATSTCVVFFGSEVSYAAGVGVVHRLCTTPCDKKTGDVI